MTQAIDTRAAEREGRRITAKNTTWDRVTVVRVCDGGELGVLAFGLWPYHASVYAHAELTPECYELARVTRVGLDAFALRYYLYQSDDEGGGLDFLTSRQVVDSREEVVDAYALADLRTLLHYGAVSFAVYDFTRRLLGVDPADPPTPSPAPLVRGRHSTLPHERITSANPPRPDCPF